MKITVLGSSHGNPTPGHFQTSVLIESGGNYYLVDAGEPANALLINRGILAAQLSAVFITHMHIDHTGGLPSLLMQAGKHRPQFPEKKLQLYLPDAAGGKALLDWMEANEKPQNCGFALNYMYCGNTYADDTVNVSFIPTDHMTRGPGNIARSYAIFMELEGKKVLFSGDLAADFSDFPVEKAKKCDLVFCELTHFNLEKNIHLLQQISPEKLVFYHVHTPHQLPEGAAKVMEKCAQLPYPVVIAADGTETIL
ncbi:MAG: ribonuclease Z [Lentisphaeria bacterium]|nr:ribonuclease Z [Lentisphaeria bacterium]